VCIGNLSGMNMSDPVYSERPGACTDPDAYASMEWSGPMTIVSDAAPSDAEATPAAPSDAEATPAVADAAVTPVASAADSAAVKPTSPAPPARASSTSASASASPSTTPTSGAGKAAVSALALGAALLFASAF
jgi:hypothetical protein